MGDSLTSKIENIRKSGLENRTNAIKLYNDELIKKFNLAINATDPNTGKRHQNFDNYQKANKELSDLYSNASNEAEIRLLMLKANNHLDKQNWNQNKDNIDSWIKLGNVLADEIKKIQSLKKFHNTENNQELIKIAAQLEVYVKSLNDVVNNTNRLIDKKSQKQVNILYESIDACLSSHGFENKSVMTIDTPKAQPLPLDTHEAPEMTFAANDAQAIVNRVDMTELLTKINFTIAEEMRSSEKSLLKTLVRKRFEDRRDVQIALLRTAGQLDSFSKDNQNNNLNIPATQMALLIAVYQSLQSEGMSGEKRNLFKSKLKSIIEDTCVEYKFDINNYNTVSGAVKIFDLNFGKNHTHNEKEIQLLTTHVTKVTLGPLEYKRREIINHLNEYILSRTNVAGVTKNVHFMFGSTQNRDKNLECARALKTYLENRKNKCSSILEGENSLVHISSFGISENIKADSIKGTPADSRSIHSSQLKNIIHEIAALNKMEKMPSKGASFRK